MITIGTILTVISCEVEITNREAKSLLRSDLFLEREELRVHNSNISGLWAEAHTGSKRILTLEDNIVRLDQTGNPGVQFASKFLEAVSKCLDTRPLASVGLVVENERGVETLTMSLPSALDELFRALEARDYVPVQEGERIFSFFWTLPETAMFARRRRKKEGTVTVARAEGGEGAPEGE